MTSDVTPGQSEQDLGWLLEDFVERVPGADSALLASSDGIKLAVAGLSEGQADTAAAVTSVMSAGDGLPAGAQVALGGGPGTVGTVLGVLAAPDADPGVVGYEMATLIQSVAEHLLTPARGGAGAPR
jgi:predicted regulator of Ras-like GTPase activity (Roadblock/LC7/MglB family)